MLWELLRKTTRNGFLSSGKSGTRGLSALTYIPVEVIDRALPILLDDGCVTKVDGGYEIFIKSIFFYGDMAEKPSGWRIYFLRHREGHLVKIGTSSGPVAARVRVIRSMSPVQLELIGSIRAKDRLEESEWHRRFSAQRHHGEWFAWNDELANAVEQEIELRGTRGA